MTLIVLYFQYDKIDRNAIGITCLSDSLISSITNYEQKLTEQSIKILNLTCNNTCRIINEPNVNHPGIGFAYAGHIGVAMHTYNIAQIALQNLTPLKTAKDNCAPSIKAISIMISNIFKHIHLNYAIPLGEVANTEIVVFGYCQYEKIFKAFHIRPIIVNFEHSISCTDLNIMNINYFAFGSGRDSFNKYVNDNSEIHVQTNFRNFLKDSNKKCKSVGGYLQRVFVNSGKFKYYADIEDWNNINSFATAQVGGFTFNNCYLDDYMVSFPMRDCI